MVQFNRYWQNNILSTWAKTEIKGERERDATVPLYYVSPKVSSLYTQSDTISLCDIKSTLYTINNQVLFKLHTVLYRMPLFKIPRHSLESLFIQHCRNNNLERVRICISRGVDVNTVSEDGRWSGLIIAAMEN